MPLAELALLLTVGQAIGVLPTVAIVLVTGVVGASLARAEGLRTLFEFQRQASSGTIPAGPLADGAMILVAAALLLTPGMLTDAVGFGLLVPPVRAVVRRLLGRYFAGSVRVTTFGVNVGPAAGEGPETQRTPGGPEVLDAEFERRPDQ
ncbi:MAG: FxsA family protein [Planctomycetota bacterium]